MGIRIAARLLAIILICGQSALASDEQSGDKSPSSNVLETQLVVRCATHRYMDEFGDDCDPAKASESGITCRGTCGETVMNPLLPVRALEVTLENGQPVTIDFDTKRTIWLRFSEQLGHHGQVTFVPQPGNGK